MAQDVISTRANRADIGRLLAKIPRLINNPGDASNAVNAFKVRIGLQALSLIKQAFITKAKGGTDEAGDSWPQLAKSTIAYSRRHPGVLWPGKKRAPYRPSWMLTEAQRKRWWELNAKHGAAIAWTIIKEEGGKTLIGEYGDTPVQTLRDTGLLLNSLSPGIQPDAAGSSPPNVPQQVFQVTSDAVIIGTNRKHAVSHHQGIPGKLPQRRLWPEPMRWPSSWWDMILDQARQGLLDIVAHYLR